MIDHHTLIERTRLMLSGTEPPTSEHVTPRERAEAFAKKWCARSESACDEATLATMIQWEVEAAMESARNQAFLDFSVRLLGSVSDKNHRYTR